MLDPEKTILKGQEKSENEICEIPIFKKIADERITEIEKKMFLTISNKRIKIEQCQKRQSSKDSSKD